MINETSTLRIFISDVYRLLLNQFHVEFYVIQGEQVITCITCTRPFSRFFNCNLIGYGLYNKMKGVSLLQQGGEN